jgi:hypothetical protein
MKSSLAIALIVLFTLPGCATGIQKNARFSNDGLSLNTSPDGWEKLDVSNALMAWKNRTTGSRISIHRHVANSLSYPATVRLISSALKIFASDKYQQGGMSLEWENEIFLGERKFYEALWSFEVTPMEGLQVAGKLHAYMLKTAKFDYVFNLVTVTGAYEKDRAVFEKLVQGLSIM